MKKKNWLALMLALTMTFGLGAPAALAADETKKAPAAETAAEQGAEETPAESEPEPDPEGTLSFENLQKRVSENYYVMLDKQEDIKNLEEQDYEWQIESLRRQINEIHRDVSSVAQSMGVWATADSFTALLSQMEQYQKGKVQENDEFKLRSARNLQNMTLITAELQYIQMKGYEAQDDALSRTQEQTERTLEEMRLRHELGQISDLALKKAEVGLAQLVSNRETLRMGIDNGIMGIKAMVGVDLEAPLTLKDLPAVTAEQLSAMDLKKDLAAARERSFELYNAQKQYDDYRKDGYIKTMVKGLPANHPQVVAAEHTLASLDYKNKDAQLQYERRFRTLFNTVKNDAQVLELQRLLVEEQEAELAASKLKFEQGNISQNTYSDAQNKLADAQDAVRTAERTLFSDYRRYQWAVDYGILN